MEKQKKHRKFVIKKKNTKRIHSNQILNANTLTSSSELKPVIPPQENQNFVEKLQSNRKRFNLPSVQGKIRNLDLPNIKISHFDPEENKNIQGSSSQTTQFSESAHFTFNPRSISKHNKRRVTFENTSNILNQNSPFSTKNSKNSDKKSGIIFQENKERPRKMRDFLVPSSIPKFHPKKSILKSNTCGKDKATSSSIKLKK